MQPPPSKNATERLLEVIRGDENPPGATGRTAPQGSNTRTVKVEVSVQPFDTPQTASDGERAPAPPGKGEIAAQSAAPQQAPSAEPTPHDVPNSTRVHVSTAERLFKPLRRLSAAVLRSFGTRAVHVGVELTPDSLRLVGLEPNGGQLDLILAEQVDLPPDMNPGHKKFSDYLQLCLMERFGPAQRLQVWSTLPAEQVEVVNLAVPKAGGAELNAAVAWMARKERPFDDAKDVFDFAVQGPVDDNGQEKLAITAYHAPKALVEERKALFAKAKYPLTGLVADCFLPQDMAHAGWLQATLGCTALLNIGPEWTRIDLFANKSLVLSRGVKTGADSIYEALRHEHAAWAQPAPGAPLRLDGDPAQPALSLEAAKKLFFCAAGLETPPCMGQPGAELTPDQAFELAKPALGRLVRQVERTFTHSSSMLRNPAVEQVFLCGPMAGHEPLQAHLREQLGLPVTALDPLLNQGVDPEAKGKRMARRAGLAIAAGLAAASAKRTPNLLHTYKHKEQDRRTARTNTLSALAGLALILASLAGLVAMQYETAANETRQGELRRRLTADGHMVTQPALAAKTGLLQKRRTQLKHTGHRLLPVAALGELWRLTPPAVRLESVELRATAPGAEKPASRLTVNGIVRGKTDEFETRLTGYLAALSNSPLVHMALVQTVEPDQRARERVLRFTLLLELKE